MKFVVKKDDLYNGIKIVERATSIKALQPVLMNILIETVDKGTIKLVATDLDYTVIAQVDAQVEEEGKITLPSKKLNDIVSRLGDKLITFEMKDGENSVNITCQNSKFDIIGISASEFPQEFSNVKFKKFLSKNDIKLISGSPRSPHSKGVCEGVNQTIIKYSISKLLDNIYYNFNKIENIKKLFVIIII